MAQRLLVDDKSKVETSRSERQVESDDKSKLTTQAMEY